MIFLFLSIFVIANSLQVYGQQKEKLVSACHIFDNLVFGLRFNSSIVEVNRRIIKQIQERGVDFRLESKEEENSFRKIGASELLIQAIRGNFSKILQEQTILYKKFTDNYNGTPEQKKIALYAAKEYIEKYAEDEESKDIIEYFRKTIPAMEKYFREKEKIQK